LETIAKVRRLYAVVSDDIQFRTLLAVLKMGHLFQEGAMQRALVVLLAGLLAGSLGLYARRSGAAENTPAGPQFTNDGKLVRPEGYRRWVYVSSGYGMSYSQKASDSMQMFTNVFVTPASYDYYLAHGTWPDKTMFVLELYGSTSQGSINKHGQYQSEFMGLDVEVKDEKRFPDKWAYFGFDAGEKAASATTPSKNDCWNCHEANAAVEHSFVQFYPELLKVAKEKGTIKRGVRLQ
jgi:Cytochrome P460